jgi:hypothetical protein
MLSGWLPWFRLKRGQLCSDSETKEYTELWHGLNTVIYIYTCPLIVRFAMKITVSIYIYFSYISSHARLIYR